jgi:hypothetical protein
MPLAQKLETKMRALLNIAFSNTLNLPNAFPCSLLQSLLMFGEPYLQ